jgi:hypothetical protein
LEAAAEAAAVQLGIPPSVAEQSLRDLSVALAHAGIRTEPAQPLLYRPAEDGGYYLTHGELRVLHVDAGGRRLNLACPLEALTLRMFDYVSEIAPKLIFLQGTTVLHGSSTRNGDRILGLCGLSRAGKTTTARTFHAHGRPLISEDLLVVTFVGRTPSVCAGAEAKVRTWSTEAARALAAGVVDVDAAPLADAPTGASHPLEAIWLLDASRRGGRFDLRAVPKTEALAQLLTHAFLGTNRRESWRAHMATMRSLVESITVSEAYLPDGLDRLDEAIARYTTNSAS